MKLEQITEDSFEAKVLKSTGLVVVDVYADWCGPCKKLTPTIEALASKGTDNLQFYKLDADNSQQLLQKYSVRGIPTLLMFKDGQFVHSLVGNQPAEVIEAELAKHS